MFVKSSNFELILSNLNSLSLRVTELFAFRYPQTLITNVLDSVGLVSVVFVKSKS